MTEQMIFNLSVAFGAIGVSWAVAFAIWAFCKYMK